jgi:hypothetical protein
METTMKNAQMWWSKSLIAISLLASHDLYAIDAICREPLFPYYLEWDYETYVNIGAIESISATTLEIYSRAEFAYNGEDDLWT